MRRLTTLAAVPLLAAGIGLAAAGPASADAPATCSGTIVGGDFGGNLEVPAGDFCLLQDTHVGGSVQLDAGALGVSLLGGNTVDGNVQSLYDIVFDVRVFNSTVGGNIEVRNMHLGTFGGCAATPWAGTSSCKTKAGSSASARAASTSARQGRATTSRAT